MFNPEDDMIIGEESALHELKDFDFTGDPNRINYVLAYKEKDSSEKVQERRELYLKNLCMNGLKLKVKREADDDGNFIVFILVQCPNEIFYDIAEKIKLKLPIAENDLYTPEKFNLLNKLGCLPDEVKWRSQKEFFTTQYTADFHDKFMKYEGICPKIYERNLIMITYEILSRTSFSREITEPAIFSDFESDNKVGIELLLARNIFDSAYPLHQKFGNTEIGRRITDRQILWDYWVKPWNFLIFQPLHIIRLYFGENLSLYFAWLGFYTSWLIPPSIAGILTVLYGIITVTSDIPTQEICNVYNRTGEILMCPLCNHYNCKTWYLSDSCTYSMVAYLIDNPATFLFALFMAMWSGFCIEFWKRKQVELQFEWDTTNYYKRNEAIRPQFEIQATERKKNPVTEEYEPYVPRSQRVKVYSFTTTMMCLIICLLLACVLGIIAYRIVLLIVLSNSESFRKIAVPIVSVTASLLNLALILLLKKFYRWLAVKLTDMEYHRTDSEHQNALTLKMYLFQFINYYSSSFYIAFVKASPHFISKYTEPCEQSGCLTELTIHLCIIIGGHIFQNVKELLIPILKTVFKREGSLKDVKNVTSAYLKGDETESRWKQDLNLLPWTHWSLFDEYLEIVIQYGFISMFVVAFPLGPLLAFLNNVLEIRVDAFKSIALMRRPMPKRAKDIGVWLPIINIISKIGIITNGAIIAFTSEFIPRLVYKYRNNSLEGYVDSTLSIRVTNNITNKYLRDFYSKQNITECRFRDFTEEYQYSSVDYEVLIARLAFLVFFEHLVFFLVVLVHNLIKDVPEFVRIQIKREEFIVQKVLISKPAEPEKVEKFQKSSSVFLRAYHKVCRKFRNEET